VRFQKRPDDLANILADTERGTDLSEHIDGWSGRLMHRRSCGLACGF